MAFLWAAGRGRVGGVLYDSKSAATTMGYPIEDSIGGGLPLYHQRIISRVQEAFPKHCGRPTLPKFRSQPSDEMERQMIRKKEGAEKEYAEGPQAGWRQYITVATELHCSRLLWSHCITTILHHGGCLVICTRGNMVSVALGDVELL